MPPACSGGAAVASGAGVAAGCGAASVAAGAGVAGWAGASVAAGPCCSGVGVAIRMIGGGVGWRPPSASQPASATPSTRHRRIRPGRLSIWFSTSLLVRLFRRSAEKGRSGEAWSPRTPLREPRQGDTALLSKRRATCGEPHPGASLTNPPRTPAR
nr:MAG: hypothetical protein DIU80_05680 [Chloroflexota bacterium]